MPITEGRPQYDATPLQIADPAKSKIWKVIGIGIGILLIAMLGFRIWSAKTVKDAADRKKMADKRPGAG
jgi:hypothetical protein